MNVLEKLSAAIAESIKLYSLHEVHELPALAGIYVVFDDSTVLYVGRAENFRRRWSSHHRMVQLSQNPNVRIVTIEYPIPELAKAERYYINLLHPTLNRTPVRDRRPVRTRPWPPKRRCRAKPWPPQAEPAAKTVDAALEKVTTEVGKIRWQAKAIISMLDKFDAIRDEGDTVSMERLLLDIRQVAGAQAQAAAQIDGVAGMASVVLAAARRGGVLM